MSDSPYQRKGCPLLQYVMWWVIGPSKWMAWNWTDGRWDVLDKPETKR